MAPDLDGIAAPKLTIYAPDEAHGDVEVVLPGGVKKKYKKVIEPDAALEANSAKTPYLFELPAVVEKVSGSWTWGVTIAAVLSVAAWVRGITPSEKELHKWTVAAGVRYSSESELWDKIRSATFDKPDPPNGKSLGTLKLRKGDVWLTHVEDKDKNTTFVRPVFDKMYDVIVEARNRPSDTVGRHVLFIGNPGIGKSWSLNYFLFRVLCESNHGLVLLRTPAGHVYAFLPHGNTLRFTNFPGDTWVNENSGGRRALLLYDVGGKGERMASGMSFGNACIVVASSPSKHNYELFKSQYQPVIFYVPTWSEAEFLSRFQGMADAKAEFDKFGGVLRDAFTATRKHALDQAIEEFDFGRVAVSALHENGTHRIVKLVPIRNHTSFAIAFHSKYIEDLWWEKKYRAVDERVVTDIFSKLSSPNRELYGKLFEKYVHRVARKLNFSAATRLNTSSASPSAEFAALKPPSDFVIQETDDTRLIDTIRASIGKKGRWVVPAAPNYPVFDAFLVVKDMVYGVQVTISAKHAPSDKDIAALETKQFVPAGMKPVTAAQQAVDAIVWVVDAVKAPGERLASPQNMGGHSSWNALPQYCVLVSCQEHDQL
jgi:hypothetical protein